MTLRLFAYELYTTPQGRGLARMASDSIAYWTEIAAWVAAIANVAVAVIAAATVSNWREGLQQQRADEAIEAVHDCAAAVGRAVGSRTRNQPAAPGKYFQDEAWACWSRFRTRYAVAKRYFPNVPENLDEKGVAIMDRLSDYCAAPAVHDEDGRRINQDFGRLRGEVEEIMTRSRESIWSFLFGLT